MIEVLITGGNVGRHDVRAGPVKWTSLERKEVATAADERRKYGLDRCHQSTVCKSARQVPHRDWPNAVAPLVSGNGFFRCRDELTRDESVVRPLRNVGPICHQGGMSGVRRKHFRGRS